MISHVFNTLTHEAKTESSQLPSQACCLRGVLFGVFLYMCVMVEMYYIWLSSLVAISHVWPLESLKVSSELHFFTF